MLQASLLSKITHYYGRLAAQSLASTVATAVVNCAFAGGWVMVRSANMRMMGRKSSSMALQYLHRYKLGLFRPKRELCIIASVAKRMKRLRGLEMR
jgi:hypothetical protein